MYMLILLGFIILANNVYVDFTGFWMLVNYVYVDSMHMLIPMDFIILGNYVYVDSNVRFYNTCELCICWFYWVLNACKLCMLIPTGVWNTCKLCICWFQWIL